MAGARNRLADIGRAGLLPRLGDSGFEARRLGNLCQVLFHVYRQANASKIFPAVRHDLGDQFRGQLRRLDKGVGVGQLPVGVLEIQPGQAQQPAGELQCAKLGCWPCIPSS